VTELTYSYLKKKACDIADTVRKPDFYLEHEKECSLSKKHFESDITIGKVRDIAQNTLECDFGHGLSHVTKVALDAGAILIQECHLREKSDLFINRNLTVVQTAGILHDSMRKMENHARAGADFAREKLKKISWFTYEEIDLIWFAIFSHEAFCRVPETCSENEYLLAGSLYDADKFRWGPDNFRETVWDMVRYSEIPMDKFLKNYSRGMESIGNIKPTFRTETGKKYGPQFIDIGLIIGKELHSHVTDDFPEYFKA